MSTHGPIKLVKTDYLGEPWYCIEKAEHEDGEADVVLERPDGGSYGFCWREARISDADVEGYRDEMLAIAEAIEKRGRVTFKRCAVAVDADVYEVRFWSPRNSRMHGVVGLHDADNLAAEIRRELAVPAKGEDEPCK